MATETHQVRCVISASIIINQLPEMPTILYFVSPCAIRGIFFTHGEPPQLHPCSQAFFDYLFRYPVLLTYIIHVQHLQGEQATAHTVYALAQACPTLSCIHCVT